MSSDHVMASQCEGWSQKKNVKNTCNASQQIIMSRNYKVTPADSTFLHVDRQLQRIIATSACSHEQKAQHYHFSITFININILHSKSHNLY